MKSTHYLLIAILAAVVVGATVWFATKAQNGKTESDSNTETQTQTLSNYNTDNYDYDLSLVLENGKFKDYSLIRTNKQTSKEETVIKSISDAISQIQQDDKYTLSLLAEPAGSDKIYFKEIVYGSDAPSRDIFAFDVNENKFTKLTSSEIAKGLAFVKVSPDQKMLFSKPADDQNGNDQVLYLVDLDKDKYETLVNLTGNETLNAGKYAMSSYSDIKWIDNNKIQYAVYDQSKKPAGEYDATSILDSLFIENRETIASNTQAHKTNEYRNDEFGFSLRYPEYYTVSEKTSSSEKIISIARNLGYIEIILIPNPENKSIVKYASEVDSMGTPTKETINGKEAYKYNNSAFGQNTHYYFEIEGYLMRINLQPSNYETSNIVNSIVFF